MYEILRRVKDIRVKKGFSHENMALEMNISQVSYSKLENGITKLTVERLFRIAEILEVDICVLLGIEQKYLLNETNKDNSTGYLQQIDNFYQENKEVYEKLIQTKDEQITFLKEMLDKLLLISA
jgi:transcriptional regulator with XRE-family HTH domain